MIYLEVLMYLLIFFNTIEYLPSYGFIRLLLIVWYIIYFARCSYMFVFDSIYLNETLRFYDTSNWPGGEFKSISSAVFVGLCSTPNPPNITVKFNIDCEFFFLNFAILIWIKKNLFYISSRFIHVLRCWLNAKKKL